MGIHTDILKHARLAMEGRLAKGVVDDIEITPFVNSDGGDGLRVLIIFKDGKIESVTGDQLLDLLLDLKESFAASGETRIPILEFATVSDMVDDGDFES